MIWTLFHKVDFACALCSQTLLLLSFLRLSSVRLQEDIVLGTNYVEYKIVLFMLLRYILYIFSRSINKRYRNSKKYVEYQCKSMFQNMCHDLKSKLNIGVYSVIALKLWVWKSRQHKCSEDVKMNFKPPS